MPSARLSLPTRVGASLGEFFAIGDDWERPSPALARSDFVLFAAVELLGLFTLELVRSVDSLTQTTAPKWVQWLTVSLGAVLLLGRRRWPLAVATLGAAHMFVVGVTMPEVMGQFTLQIVYFITTFSAVAWARDRRLMRLVVGAIVLFMFLWIAWQFVLGSSVQEIVDHTKGKARTGIFPPVPAAVALTLIVNLLFFGGAIAAGQVSWLSARLRTRLGEQARTISEQAESLRRRAVIDERLRIARELHDVVGHHVSVIGVQAGAARRVLAKRPEAAADALGAIEESSREAVTQMRGLLGTLRSIETETETETETGADVEGASGRGLKGRAPEPGLADLPALVAERTAWGVQTAYDIVESSPGAIDRLSGPVSLTLYRVAQEALANTSRHSTASSARVTVRVTEDGPSPHAEVEIVDNGRPRSGTSGTGMGQLGMRERAATHRGTAEIGPRASGGYRVRVRIPLGENHV